MLVFFFYQVVWYRDSAHRTWQNLRQFRAMLLYLHNTHTLQPKLCRSTACKPYTKVRTYHASVAVSHRLPVRQRTLFEVLLFTNCAVNATAPNYLVQLINHRNVTRTLRSGSSTDLLFVPTSRTVTHCDRCFTVASQIMWN